MKRYIFLFLTLGIVFNNYSMSDDYKAIYGQEPKMTKYFPDTNYTLYQSIHKSYANLHKGFGWLFAGLTLGSLFSAGYFSGKDGVSSKYALLSGLTTTITGLVTANFYNTYQYNKNMHDKAALLKTITTNIKLNEQNEICNQGEIVEQIDNNLDIIIDRKKTLNGINSIVASTIILAGTTTLLLAGASNNLRTNEPNPAPSLFVPNQNTKL